MTTASAKTTGNQQSELTARAVLRTGSVLSVIKRLLWVGRFVGTSPFSVEEKNGVYSVKISSLAVTYSYFISFVSIGIYLVAIVQLYATTKDFYSVIYLCTRVSVIYMVHFSFVFRRHQIVEILRQLQNLEVSISTYYPAFPTIIYCATCCTTCVTAIVMNLDVGPIIHIAIIDIGPQIIDVFTNFIFFCQMAVFNAAVIKLNEDLLKFKNSLQPSSLRPVMKQYVYLRHLCSSMNETYGVPMLLLGTATFIQVTFPLFKSISFATESSGVAWILSTWAVLHLMPAAGVMVVCQKVENQIYKTTAISIQSSIDPSTVSTDVLEQIREWDLQLRQLPIKFTARCFFDLNSTQLKIIISTAITYTVILFQNSNLSRLTYAQEKIVRGIYGTSYQTPRDSTRNN